MSEGVATYDCRDCLFFHEAGIDSSSMPQDISSRINREPLIDSDFGPQPDQSPTPEKPVDGNHEILASFQSHDLKLNLTLTDMLNEGESHQGGRKGSGFTQSSRHLADFIRKPRSNRDIDVFDSDVKNSIDDEIYDSVGDEAPAEGMWREKVLERGLEDVKDSMQLEESKLVTGMITDVVNPKEKEGITKLPSVGESLNIGTCTTAEYYFFNYLNNIQAIGRVGEFNIILDKDGTPLMFEKMGYGEDHSCLTLKPTVINDVEVPAGSLMGVKRPKGAEKQGLSDGSGSLIDIDDCEGFEFLRLSTLAVSPENRERAFGSHFTFQGENRMPGYDTNSIDDFSLKANRLALASVKTQTA